MRAQRAAPSHPDVRPTSPLRANPYEYRYLTEFQSHEPEFDYLKSLEIEEKINKVRWCRSTTGGRSHFLLSTNDKTIKLWKVGLSEDRDRRGSAGARRTWAAAVEPCCGYAASAARGRSRGLDGCSKGTQGCQLLFASTPLQQVYEKRVTCVSDFNLQNGSSTLNTGGGGGSGVARPYSPLNGSYSPEKLDLAALTAQKLGLPLRLPKVRSGGGGGAGARDGDGGGARWGAHTAAAAAAAQGQ